VTIASGTATYNFSAFETAATVLLNYLVFSNVSGTTITLANQQSGSGPQFQMTLYNNFRNKLFLLQLNACIMGSVSIPTRQEDFWVVDVDFTAMADASGVLGLLYADGWIATIVGYVNATGSLGYTIVRPLGSGQFAVLWANFTADAIDVMPPDAIIQSIRPVIIASANYDGAFQILEYGTGMNLSSFGLGTGFSNPSPAPALGTTFSSTEFYGASIGASLSALAGQQILAVLADTVERPFPSDTPLCLDTMTITGVGFAIDYTSANPIIDPQMPPPVAVASGHGLAWAVPATVFQSGTVSSGFGVFNPSSGHGLGTPATPIIE
jgi:hypothetical protein